MNNKEKNVIRHKLSDGLYIDPRLLRTGDNETEYFPFKPTEEECSPRPSVRGFGENGCLEVVAMVKPMADFLLVEITMKGEVTLLDDHDFTLKNYPIDENCELSLSSDPEMADILPDSDGRYDLKPTLLALFYDAIPPVYSTVPLTKVEGDGYVVYSEDEFEKDYKNLTENKQDHPFKNLK